MIPADHPLTRASWIWPHGNIYLNNCHCQFRYDFNLGVIPVLAPFFITADQSYRLYVNGQYVCRGPARGYQSHWPYDEVDLSSYLKAGHNFISVEAYNPGIGTFQYLHCSAAGFICAAEWGETIIRTNKESWQMRRSPANNQFIAILSRQLGFQEDFDAAKDDQSWIFNEAVPQWEKDPVFGWFCEFAYGRPPWDTLEERMIPLLREDVIIPLSISAHGIGKMKEGYRDCFNIAWQWNGSEAASVDKWLPGTTINYRRETGGLEFEVPSTEPGWFRAVTMDLGAIESGSLMLEVENCTGSEIIDCHYHQSLENGIPKNLIPVGNGGFLALATRLRTSPGLCRRNFFGIFGARQITFVCRDLAQSIKIKAAWRKAEYPFSMRGEFECADININAIHDLCRHTQQICASDAYIDTPWREQGQWWGDARIQARNTFYLDGDARLLRRGIYSISGQETSNGLTYGVAPCCYGGCILPDFSITWILTIFDYYWQTGDLEVFFDQHERIKKIFAYFDSPEVCEYDLLKYDKRFWLFEDWAPLPKRGFPTFLNLWHLYGLLHYEKLLRAAQLNTDADEVASHIARRRVAIEKYFFDQERKLFIAGRELDMQSVSEPPSVHDQVLAILLNLKSECHQNMAEERLLPFLRGNNLDCAVPTSFWSSYLFDAAKLLGFRREVFEFIKKRWTPMVPSGGTWEHFIWDESVGQSCSHAWSAHPATHLIDVMAGIRQTEPRWAAFDCKPDCGLLTAKGRILLPLPQGDFSLTWNENDLKVVVPPLTTVNFEYENKLLHWAPGEYIIRRSS